MLEFFASFACHIVSVHSKNKKYVLYNYTVNCIFQIILRPLVFVCKICLHTSMYSMAVSIIAVTLSFLILPPDDAKVRNPNVNSSSHKV